MKLSTLLSEVMVNKITGKKELDIKGICYDSRKVQKDFAFVCVVGFETDGHKYIDAAVQKGASAIVVQKGSKIPEIPENITVINVDNTRIALAALSASFYGHPERELNIIGITGTNGKTTVTTLIKSILEYKGEKVGLIGTNANMIGDTIIPTERTTPESLELFELFADMKKAGVKYVVMEVSSHSLELYRVYGITFCVGAFTNLTQDHLDFHKTMENYLNAKKKLFETSRTGVLNIDDNAGERIFIENKCPFLTYGIEKTADLRASDIKMSSRGVIFTLTYKGKEYTARIGIPGKFSVYNALTAVGVMCALGADIQEILEALTFAKGVMGRCETVYTKTDYTVIIDYAHTPDGLENIIKTVREFCQGRVITLFGCGGDRDKTKRPIMGKIAGELSDYLIVTSDNPRCENPSFIIQDILVGVNKTECAHTVIENRREAIKFALSFAQAGDVIILAGKGHETYQIIGKTKNHFDEREVIFECLDEIKR